MMLECRGLTKWFGSKEAVADLTLNIEKGKIYGLLGENGSGKTTWMKMVSGLTKRLFMTDIYWDMKIRRRSRIWQRSRSSMIS